MARKYLLIVISLLLLSVTPAVAQSEVEQLRKRVDSLEKELRELKDILIKQQQSSEKERAKVEKIEQKVTETSSNVLSAFKFKPYGFIKLDAAYDDSRTDFGNFVLYVPSESVHKDDNEFNMTARQTRLGLHIIAPEIYDWKVWGRIEFDFYGDASHENKAEPMLRHAFVELKRGNFSLIAGQTNDLISPLYPYTLNYTVGWSAGNIGYRRAQLRATYIYPLNENTELIGALALARTSGTVNEDLDLDLQNDGEDAGFPTVQARLALAIRLLTKKFSVFGISGHYGEEEIDWELNPFTLGEKQERVKSWSLNADINLPLTERVSVQGEAFVGYNLDDYFGGILQGVNPTTQEVIKSAGGWLQLSYLHNDKWTYHLGCGIDDPKDNDLSAGMRNRNQFYFGNVVYSLIPPVDIGVEYSYWKTEYEKKRAGRAHRIQASIIYKW